MKISQAEMKRTLFGVIIGSLIGGISFLPPAIPVSMMLLSSTPSNVINALFWQLPLIGLFVGGVVGGVVGKNRVSFNLFRDKSLSIFWWCVCIFGLLGVEVGFVFSPIAGIGLGNIPSSGDLWILSFWLGIAGMFLGAIVGLLVLATHLVAMKYWGNNKRMEK